MRRAEVRCEYARGRGDLREIPPPMSSTAPEVSFAGTAPILEVAHSFLPITPFFQKLTSTLTFTSRCVPFFCLLAYFIRPMGIPSIGHRDPVSHSSLHRSAMLLGAGPHHGAPLSHPSFAPVWSPVYVRFPKQASSNASLGHVLSERIFYLHHHLCLCTEVDF